MDVAHQPCHTNVHPRGSLKRHTRTVDDAHGARILNSPVETASTLCSRNDCAAKTESIHVGPAPWSPPALILPSNPESTPPPSTPAPLDADFRFFCHSRTRGATTPRFRPPSPSRRPLRGEQLQEVRPDVSGIENALHRTFRTPSAYFRPPTRLNNLVSAFRIPQNPHPKTEKTRKFKSEVVQKRLQRSVNCFSNSRTRDDHFQRREASNPRRGSPLQGRRRGCTLCAPFR